MIKVIKNILAKKAIKKVVKLVSKNNPYALAAVELYGLYEVIQEKKNGR